jgi:hypothetical protein
MFRLIYFRLYLPFLLNVFYVLYFNLLLNILFPMFYEVFIYAMGVECVCVGRVANIYVTRSGTMHLT